MEIVRQSDISVGRDFTGRDRIENNTTVIVGRERLTAMQALIALYWEERANNTEFKETIEDLQHYLETPEGGAPIGLLSKLQLAGREDMYMEAALYKERFFKKLQRHLLSQAAQEIFALVLGKAVVNFRNYIRPLIDADFERGVIQAQLVEKVIDPVMQELEENVLRLQYPDLEGMVYFLTGNCHISWHKPS